MNLKTCKNVSLDKAGVDAWGIYVLFVETDKWNNSYEHRVFLADNLVCQYKLPIGGAKTRTTWTRNKFTNRADALAWLENSEGKAYGGSLRWQELRAMVGAPVLVQLTESDVENVRKGLMPNARYRGQQKHTGIYGKIDMITPLAFNLKGGLPTAARPAASMVAASAASMTSASLTGSTATVTPLSVDGMPVGGSFTVPAESMTITVVPPSHSHTVDIDAIAEAITLHHHAADEPIGDEPF